MTADMMKVVFARLVSPEEQELRSYVQSNGGADKVSRNFSLLKDMLSGSNEKPGQLTLLELQRDANKDIEDFLQEDAKVFENKFQLMKSQIQDVKEAVHHETDRIIDFLKSGPQERIRDRVSCVSRPSWNVQALRTYLKRC